MVNVDPGAPVVPRGSAWRRLADQGWRRRELLGGALIGGAAVAAAGGLSALAAREQDFEPGRITILSGSDQSPGGQRGVLAQAWTGMFPDHAARIISVSGGAEEIHSQMLAAAQSGRSDVDVYNLDNIWLAEFARAGHLWALDDRHLTLDGFLQQPLETCRYDGRLWALPFNTDAALLYYRGDLVKQPPTSWPEVEEETRRVFRNGPPATLAAGYTGQLANYEGLTVNALEAIWSAGGDAVDDAGHVVVDRDLAVRGLRWVAAGLASNNPPIVLRESRHYDESSSLAAFRTGKVLFMRNWPIAYRALEAARATTDAGSGPGGPMFNVTALPGGSVLGGQNLAVARTSPRRRAAQALIEFLTGEFSQHVLFARGGFAATREIVYHDPELLAKYRYVPDLLRGIKAARPRPSTPHYPLFSEVFRSAVGRALTNDGRVAAADVHAMQAALRGRRS